MSDKSRKNPKFPDKNCRVICDSEVLKKIGFSCWICAELIGDSPNRLVKLPVEGVPWLQVDGVLCQALKHSFEHFGNDFLALWQGIEIQIQGKSFFVRVWYSGRVPVDSPQGDFFIQILLKTLSKKEIIRPAELMRKKHFKGLSLARVVREKPTRLAHSILLLLETLAEVFEVTFGSAERVRLRLKENPTPCR